MYKICPSFIFHGKFSLPIDFILNMGYNFKKYISDYIFYNKALRSEVQLNYEYRKSRSSL